MKNNKKQVRDALLAFGKKYGENNFHKEGYFTPNKEADELIWKDPLAYLIAVILDQSMKAERVWEIPYILRQRLGHLDVQKIANMTDDEIVKIFNEKPKLHRFPNTTAMWVKKACQLLINQYEGKAENVWNDNPRPGDLHRRLEQFDGIGQKKASMATNILARDFKIDVRGKRGIDISYDIHVRRVFLRSGLVKKDSMDRMVRTARKLNSDYPGELDNPCWVIGREFCSPSNPDCKNCPIASVCSQRTEIKLSGTI